MANIQNLKIQKTSKYNIIGRMGLAKNINTQKAINYFVEKSQTLKEIFKVYLPTAF